MEEPQIVMGPYQTPTSKTLFNKTIEIQIQTDKEDNEHYLTEQVIVKLIVDGDVTVLTLTSEEDLFFHYTCLINQNNFYDLAKKQGLLEVTLQDFGPFVAKLLNSIVQDSRNYIIALFLSENGQGQLTFTENFKNYKYLEILTLFMKMSDPEVIRADITSRYLNLKTENIDLKLQVEKLKEVIKLEINSKNDGDIKYQ